MHLPNFFNFNFFLQNKIHIFKHSYIHTDYYIMDLKKQVKWLPPEKWNGKYAETNRKIILIFFNWFFSASMPWVPSPCRLSPWGGMDGSSATQLWCSIPGQLCCGVFCVTGWVMCLLHKKRHCYQGKQWHLIQLCTGQSPEPEKS